MSINVQMYFVTDVMINSRIGGTDVEISKAIMTYLRNAGDRCGGRKRRTKRQREDEIGEE